MSDLPPPPPVSPATPTPAPSSGAAGWKIATAVTALAGLALSGTVYVVMDRRVDDLQSDLDTTREQLAAAEERAADGGLGALGDLLGGLSGSGDLGDLGDLGEMLGGLGGLGDVDPILFQCLTPADGGLGLGGEGSIPEGDVAIQVDAIEAIVEDERGVAVDGDLDIEFVSLDEVQRRAVDINSQELDAAEAAADATILTGLGAVEPGTDLVQEQLAALDAGVGGFYNPDDQKLVIGSETMDGLGAMVTSHELVHAMTDATFGLPDTQAIAASQGADAAYAALNAIEGDASLYSQRFVGQHLPFDQLMALQSTSDDTTAAMAELPHFVNRNLQFPYIEGMTFTCDVFLEGGWEAVDQTYATLPTTTAQILFPDRYRAGEAAVDVRDPAGPSGWTEADSDTFGAADLLFLLEAPGNDTDAALSEPKERAAAWAGGEVHAWTQGDRSAVGLVLADRGEATPLCDTVTDFYAAAFPGATRGGDTGDATFDGDVQDAVVTCDGAEVALGTGPDLDTARAAVS